MASSRSPASRAARGSAGVWVVLCAAAGCSGGGSVGEHCATVADCGNGLQCLDHTCLPRCRHHVDCGDGYRCDDGSCQVVDSQIGQGCTSELECGPGQTCRLNQVLSTPVGSCQLQTQAAIPGSRCAVDDDCRLGACALGHCLELCARDGDCRREWTCAAIPRLSPDATDVLGGFTACLSTDGSIDFDVPLDPDVAAPQVRLPVPSSAVSMVMVAEIDDPAQFIGASRLVAVDGQTELYREPIDRSEYYANPVRHEPLPGVSTLQIPGSPDLPLAPGAYTVTITTRRLDPGPLSRNRRLRVVEKLGTGAALDLHFYFVDLAGHPCLEQIGADLSAATAPELPGFRDVYLAELRQILERAGVTAGATTYTDVADRPELSRIDGDRAGELFGLASRDTGVSVFFVRSIAPAGMQVLVDRTPGVPLPGTRASGVAVSMDTLCYRDWSRLARQSAHAVARAMGLHRNLEPDGGQDRIADSSTSSDNLMHYNENGGTDLSAGQRAILRLSPVLR